MPTAARFSAFSHGPRAGALVAGLMLLTGAASAQQAPPADTSRSSGVFWDAVRRGASMEEVARVREPKAATPDEAFRLLQTGNNRFFSGAARRPGLNAFERRAQIITQTPFAAVLGCSDSRVPTELVFDQDLGDIFSIRVAGNVIEPGTAGSLEYAVEHLKSHILVVMGHEGCGAVKAAMLPLADQNREPENVRYLLSPIRPSVSNLPDIHDDKAMTREAVIRNIRAQVQELKRNPVVQAGIARGQIQVIGAYYEITSGAVDFIDEGSLQQAPVLPPARGR